MAATTNLAMTLLEESQSQKHVTINDALNTIDGAVGGIAGDTRVISSWPLSVLSTDAIILASGTGARTATLPTTGIALGKRIHIKDVSTAVGKLTVAATGGALIDGVASWIVHDWITVVYDGTNWVILDMGPSDVFMSTTANNSLIGVIGASTSLTVNANNDAILVAITPNRTLDLTKLQWSTAATSAGNYDIGVYSAAGTRLWSKGSTAWPAINTEVVDAVTPMRLRRGTLYYIGLSGSDSTATYRGQSSGNGLPARMTTGLLFNQRFATHHPLPASVTIGTTNFVVRHPNIILRED